MNRIGPAPLFVDAMDLHLAACSTVSVMVTARTAADRLTWARTIHDRSARRDGPFVAVCGDAVPPGDGARSVEAWFGRAAGGTLFIDRIGDSSGDAQDELLSLLTAQSRAIEGATTPRGDRHVRVVSGSNRSLRADLAVGAFSDALFYRLNVIHIDLTHREEFEGEP